MTFLVFLYAGLGVFWVIQRRFPKSLLKKSNYPIVCLFIFSCNNTINATFIDGKKGLILTGVISGVFTSIIALVLVTACSRLSSTYLLQDPKLSLRAEIWRCSRTWCTLTAWCCRTAVILAWFNSNSHGIIRAFQLCRFFTLDVYT